VCNTQRLFPPAGGLNLPELPNGRQGRAGYTPRAQGMYFLTVFNPVITGERIRGNSRVLTILPILHTGQMQGLFPVSLANRSRFVSGGCFRFSIVSIFGFSSGTNCKSRLCLMMWLYFTTFPF